MYSQDNIESLFMLIGSFPGGDFVVGRYYDVIRTRDSVWPNQLINLKLGNLDIKTFLNHLEFELSNGQLPGLLMCNPESDDHRLLSNMITRGYSSSRWFAMSHYLNRAKRPPTSSSLKINKVDREDELQLWLKIVEAELMDGHPLNNTIFRNLMHHQDITIYLGYEGSKPVTTAMLYSSKAVAGMYLVSTLKAYRKRGYGQLMAWQCLERAMQLNCSRVDIQATSMGYGLYISMGFLNHGDIHVYRINPSDKVVRVK